MYVYDLRYRKRAERFDVFIECPWCLSREFNDIKWMVMGFERFIIIIFILLLFDVCCCPFKT